MVILIATLGIAILVAAFFPQLSPTNTDTTMKLSSYTPPQLGHSKSNKDIPLPAGVNFGSWLSLEDYFYVGDTGSVQVATPDGHKSAVCLPPLHTGQGPTWQSETDLLTSLIQTAGLAHALKLFHAHRTSYVTEDDLIKLSQWGVKHVRVPLSWCLTDHDFEDIDITNTTQEYTDYLLQHYTCADPYYTEDDVLWPAVPRKMLTTFLRSCAKYGITASLDLHTYPGATSPGTFSGLWPRAPRFWKHDTASKDDDNDLGRQLYKNSVGWLEQLAEDDPKAFDGILGISPMNEPAHLAGIFRNTDRDYLPPLTPEEAARYLERLDNSPDIPDGPHLRVFLWLQDAIDVFRESLLPKLGKQLHVNVHESALSPQVCGDDDNDLGGRHPTATNLVAAWWSKVTHKKERSSWAVLDMHHYHAWEPACQGASDGPPIANYTCTDTKARADALDRCTSWATETFRTLVNHHCEESAQLMSGEFSTSTHHSVRHACNDLGTLKASYWTQLEAAHKAKVKLYYWSYKMPHGGASKNAWSFSQLMYLLGVNPHPDVSNYNCGGHIPHEDEVTDDWFGS